MAKNNDYDSKLRSKQWDSIKKKWQTLMQAVKSSATQLMKNNFCGK